MIGLIACIAAMLTGCSGTQAPTFKVLEATIKDRTPQGAVLLFVLEADNPNGDALPLRDVSYTVSLNGKQIFSGTRSAEVVLRRFGRQQFTLPAAYALAADQLAPDGAAYAISGSLVYIAPGALAETLFDQEIIRPSADFSGEGTLK